MKNTKKLRLSVFRISVMYVLFISAVVGSYIFGFSKQYEDDKVKSAFLNKKSEFSELTKMEALQDVYNRERNDASLEVWNLQIQLKDINEFEASRSEHDAELNALSEQLNSLEAAEQAKTNELNRIQADIDKQ